MKDEDSKKAAEGLKNPNFSPSGEPQPIEDKDFTDKTNDVSKDAKMTLGSFLSGKSSVNRYRITPVSFDAKIKTRGPDAALTNPEDNGQDVFANSNIAKMTLQSYGLGVKTAKEKVDAHTQHTFFTEKQLKEILSKTSSGDPFLSGHNLLKSVPTETQSPVSKNDPKSPAPASIGPENLAPKGLILLQKVHEQLKEGNMYHPEVGAPFFQNPGNTNEEIATRGLFSIQRNLGSFDINGKRVQVSDMSANAMALLLRAVGNNAGSDQVLENKSLGVASFTALNFLRPEQLGLSGNGIDIYRLRTVETEFTIADKGAGPIAATATGQDDFGIKLMSDGNLITRGSPPNNNELPNLQSSPNNKGSFTQLNSFLEPFGSKFSSAGMFLQAGLGLVAALTAAIAVQQLTSIAGTKAKMHDIYKPATMTKGSRRIRSKPDEFDFEELMYRIFEITNTDYDFADCVGVGIPVMYGFPNSIGNSDNKDGFAGFKASFNSLFKDPQNLLAVAQNFVLTPAYYANFTRRLLQESTTIFKAVSDVATTSVTGALENLLKAVENIINSALYKFIMISAGVGDVALKAKFGSMSLSSSENYLPEKNIPSPYEVQVSGISKKKDEVVGDVITDLDGGGQLGIYRNQVSRWGGTGDQKTGLGENSLSLKTFLASQKYPTHLQIQSDIDKYNREIYPSTENVQKIEDAIESEYMPFYIHDLRTQEVMSMPAFITEFGESFNASYASVEGIGRQDPVRLYQKTERQVTFGFMLVSFGKEDHDHMWWTINKLVAMCYPQYSVGRLRETSDGTRFIQPFSQVQAASPMVRLRLGDVFKSNYSKFGLARLFGIENGSIISVSTKELLDANKELNNAKIQAGIRIRDELARMKKNEKPLDGLKGKKVVIATPALFYNPVRKSQTARGQDVGEIVVTIKDVYDDKKSKTLICESDRLVQPPGPWTIAPDKILRYDDALSNEMIESDSDVKAAYDKIKKLKDADDKVLDSNFFSSESGEKGNAIVRSFESTRGRGVAGFITSLGLDYGMGNFPWSTSMGSKAPMIVKISLGFTPITDLPLGLDYNGEIRNPSHPVGNLAGSYGDPYYDIDSSDTASMKPMSRKSVNGKINDSSKYKVAEKKIENASSSNSDPSSQQAVA